MQFLLFLVAATLLLGLTEGFIVTRHRTQIMSSNAAVSRSMKLSSMVSYKERLELARKEKQDRANGIVPERLREKKNEKKNASRLPMNSHEMKGPLFSKEIEDSINFVVDILRTRSQSDDPLSFTDLNRLELAIESIIADARRSSDAGISVERTQRDAFKEATERDQDHRKKDTFYGAFRGFGTFVYVMIRFI